MTTKEFSNQFDILLNSYISQNSFGDAANNTTIVLDEYEKSVFLTQAQEDIIKAYYSGQYQQDQFDSTEQVKRAMSSLIKECNLQGYAVSSQHLSNNTTIWDLPIEYDVWYIIYESLHTNNKNIPVIPATYDEWHKLKRNPFRGPTKDRAIRLDFGKGFTEQALYLITKETVDVMNDRYTISYISKPSPIILVDLTDSNLSINGVNVKSECNLHPSTHILILNRAIQLAIAAHKS